MTDQAQQVSRPPLFSAAGERARIAAYPLIPHEDETRLRGVIEVTSQIDRTLETLADADAATILRERVARLLELMGPPSSQLSGVAILRSMYDRGGEAVVRTTDGRSELIDPADFYERPDRC